ncbi:leucyl aminopeptidase [Neomegalonema sp.]|uniref:leucyl aminopeptidase n=1 Tax=Neomegalonema sp. TaxID=2039713 RepID=UPI0026277975|nr:leucyl aminopeptidase [Neomegalonema sp.]MDD2869408.1 leucyl aminopeptidase [Neomegalonema sp.]
MSITFGDSAAFGEEARIWIAPVFEGEDPPKASKKDPVATLTARALASGSFKGKAGESFGVAFPQGLEADRLVLLGAGPRETFDAPAARALGGRAVVAAGRSGGVARLDLTGLGAERAELAVEVAAGISLRLWRFVKYKSKPDPADKGAPEFRLRVAEALALKAAWSEVEALVEGVLFARELVNEPGNVLHPESYAERLAELKAEGLKVRILDEPAMEKLGMGALLGVGRGSARGSRLVTLEWRGAQDKKAAPLAVIGKGVTFDTGGVSIKSAAGMEEMTSDMGGSAVTVGLMLALARRKAKANVVGVVGLVENMPDGEAIRPGDILTSMSGQTIEVINTDAEGRLVLADALWYAQQSFKPRALIDLATLTGAIVVALGSENAGLFSNDDDLANGLLSAARAEGEGLWRMPLGQAYDDKIKSRLADMKNTGGREAGSITAAQFLQRFVEAGTPWAHLDIAGVTLSSEDRPTAPRGATGWGVATLNRLVRDVYEEK